MSSKIRINYSPMILLFTPKNLVPYTSEDPASHLQNLYSMSPLIISKFSLTILRIFKLVTKSSSVFRKTFIYINALFYCISIEKHGIIKKAKRNLLVVAGILRPCSIVYSLQLSSHKDTLRTASFLQQHNSNITLSYHIIIWG